MSGSFSLVEKLAVTAAFCAMVAVAVGTESDPGIVAQAKPPPQSAVRGLPPDVGNEAPTPASRFAAKAPVWWQSESPAPVAYNRSAQAPRTGGEISSVPGQIPFPTLPSEPDMEANMSGPFTGPMHAPDQRY